MERSVVSAEGQHEVREIGEDQIDFIPNTM
jgi:hypothetical protein